MPADTFEYLRTDYQSMRSALIARARARYPGTWNDFATSNFGVALLDLTAWAMTTLSYTQNRTAAENFIPTMTLRESAVRWGDLAGYVVRGATPATVPCVAELAVAATAEVTMALGTPVRSGDASAIVFELDRDYTIAVGEVTPIFTAVTFDPNGSGARNIPTVMRVAAGSYYADCLDLDVDLRAYVSVGMLFRLDAAAPEYAIVSVDIAPDAQSYNRLTLATPYLEADAESAAEVVDRRVYFVQGQTQVELATAPDDPRAWTFPLSYTPVISGTVQVSVNGVVWTETPSLVMADPSQLVFQVRTLATGVTVVAFGDGKFGAAPATAASVSFTYRTGGGAVGNIQSGAIASSITGLIVSLAAPVTVTVTNQQPGQGGLDPETVDEARAKIPPFIAANGRCVTREDYQALAVAYPGPEGQVRFARATVREQVGVLEGNLVAVYAWSAAADGSLVPCTVPLKAALTSYLQARAVATDHVLVADGSATPLAVAVRLATTPGYDPGAVEDSVLAYTRAFVASLAPGAIASAAAFTAGLLSVSGVSGATVAAPAGDVIPPTPVTVFTPPQAEEWFSLIMNSGDGGLFTGQASVANLAAWGVLARLNGRQLDVSPAALAGFARLDGTGLDPTKLSTVNLTTGLVQIYCRVAETFELGLTTAQAYARVAYVDLYAGYTGDTSVAKRREIRSAVRVWAGGVRVGAPLFSVAGSSRLSRSNAAATILAVPGVSTVITAAFGSPGAQSTRIDPAERELLTVRNVYLNNFVD